MMLRRLRLLSQRYSRLTLHQGQLAIQASVLAAFALVAGLDLLIELPWVLRLVLACSILTTAVVVYLRWNRTAQRIGDRDAARLVETAHPDLGQSVRTAAEVSTGTQTHAPIEAALLRQVSERLKPLPLETLASHRALIPVALSAGALGLFWILTLSMSGNWRTAALRAVGFPTTFTRIQATASPEQLKGTGSSHIVASLSGRRVSTAVLHIRSQGEEWREIQMTPVAPQQFDAMLGDLQNSQEYYVTSGDGRSRRGQISVYVPPKLQTVHTRLGYPEYTSKPATELESGDFEAVEGTRARVDLKFDKPVSTARVELSNGSAFPVTLNGERGNVEIAVPKSELTWKITGNDTSGSSFETAPFRLKGIEDKLPTVRLAEPKEDVEVTPLQELIARVQVKDDFGVASLGIVLQVGTATGVLLEKNFEARDVRETAEMATAFLERYQLTLNDSLIVYAYATDHKPRDGARAVSPLVAVDIREFKRLWRDGKEGPECKCLDLLEPMISQERRIFSDSTQLKELTSGLEVPKATAMALADRQQAVMSTGHELAEILEDFLDPELQPTKQTLADAMAAMANATGFLKTLDLAAACKEESTALTALLQLRKQLIYKISKNRKGGRMTKKNNSEEKPPTLTEVAEKIENAAKEEASVAAQAKTLRAGGQAPDALRRQLASAIGDAGEALSTLDTHPAATKIARQRGQAAEALMKESAKALDQQPASATPALARAETALHELAEHLRVLDRSPDEQTFAKFEQRAQQGAQCLSQCAACSGNSGKTDATKASPSGADQTKAKAPSGADQQGETRTANSTDTHAQLRQKVANLAEQAVTLDDTLKRWAEGAQQTGSGESNEKTPLAKLRESQGTEQLAGELKALSEKLRAQVGKNQQETAAASGSVDESLATEAKRLAGKHQELAQALRQERDAMRQTRAQQLTQLRERVQEMLGSRQNTGSNQTRVNQQPPPAMRLDMQVNTTQINPGLTIQGLGSPNTAGSTNTTRTNGMGTRLSGTEAEETLARLHSIGDSELDQLASLAEQNKLRQVFAMRAWQSIDARLGVLLNELRRTAPVALRDSKIPDGYRRVVEDYFQKLSDDFAGEEISADEPQGR